METLHFSEKEKQIIRELAKYDFSEKTEKESTEPKLITLGWFFQKKVYTNSEYQIIVRPQECGMIWYKEGFQAEAYYYLLTPILLMKKLIQHRLIFPLPIDETVKKYSGWIYLGTQEFQKEDQEYLYFASNEKMSKIDGRGSWFDENGKKKYCGNKFSYDQVPMIDFFGIWPIITPELKKLVEDDFKTTEYKTLCWTRMAAIIAFMGMLASIILS
ncbi:MAG: hypothetical protein MJZ52_00620 [Bacteroidales bacterium]|nr:hypothetical protein [Bacteroidales bacterium]